MTRVKMVPHDNSPRMLKFHGRQPRASKIPRQLLPCQYQPMPLFSPHPLYPNSCWFVTLTLSAPSFSFSLTRPLNLKAKSRLTGKDPDAGKDFRQKKKGAAEYEMVR